MPKYQVSGVIDCDAPFGEVEAPTADEALKKAWDELEISTPSVCHQCSSHMNVGDVIKLIVYNVDDYKDTAEG